MSAITRILSDLHFGHPAGLLKTPEQILPLLEGAGRVLFNGDSVELRFLKERGRGLERLEELRALCSKAGVEPVFLNGNHDPALCDCDCLELMEGRILVTHGDILFPGLSPWSREALAIERAHREALEALDHPASLEQLLAAARRAACSIERLGPRPHHHADVRSAAGFLLECWPPWRPLKILGCWAKAPALAAALALKHRPAARCVVIGHTHFGGLWRRGGRIVVNTGGFLPFSRRFAVDVGPEGAIVRRITRRGGHFCLAPGGEPLALD